MEYIGPPDDPHAHSMSYPISHLWSPAKPIIRHVYTAAILDSKPIPISLAILTFAKTFFSRKKRCLRREKNSQTNLCKMRGKHQFSNSLLRISKELSYLLTLINSQNPIKNTKYLKPLPIMSGRNIECRHVQVRWDISMVGLGFWRRRVDFFRGGIRERSKLLHRSSEGGGE